MTEKTKYDDKYMTIPRLAQELEMSDSTIRRYIRNYAQFFEIVIINGWEHYEAAKTLRILRRITGMKKMGRNSRIRVLEVLEKEFEVIESKEKQACEINRGAGILEFGPESMKVMKDIRDALVRMTNKEQSGKKRLPIGNPILPK